MPVSGASSAPAGAPIITLHQWRPGETVDLGIRGDGTREPQHPDGFGSARILTLPNRPQLAIGGATVTPNTVLPSLASAALTAIGNLRGREDAPATSAGLTTPIDRAREAGRALQAQWAQPGHPAQYRDGMGRALTTDAWPLGQVLHGRIDLAAIDGDYRSVNDLLRELERYRSGDGFTGGINGTSRFYDDNEWIGLAQMQAHAQTGDGRYLAAARRVFDMIATGEHRDGGMYWREDDKSGRHTCSTAPAIQLALRLHEATGESRYLEFAIRQQSWLNQHLRLPNGLYADNLNDNGSVDRAIFSYNQGSAIGADVQLYRATGDERYLARARTTADASIAYFSRDDRLWKQAPVFNAIYFRNLLQLTSVDHDQQRVAFIDRYLERAWSTARNAKTGLFTDGNIGHYGDAAGTPIDQGAFMQMYAMRALPQSDWSRLT